MPRSRGELEEIINRGECVMLPNGHVVTTIEGLPSAVDLAGNDIVKKQQALGDLQAARDALDRQIAAASSGQSDAGGQSTTAPVGDEPKSDTVDKADGDKSKDKSKH